MINLYLTARGRSVIIVSPDKTRKDFLSKNPDQDDPRVPFYSIVI